MALFAPTIVLMYHRVAEVASDLHDLSVPPDRFAEHVDHLRRRCRVVPLAEARDRRLMPRVVITFDDGYADNVTTAAPLLATAGLPATYFVTAGRIGTTRETWFDELELVVMEGSPRARHLELDVDGAPLSIDLDGPDGRSRAHAAVHRRLRPLRIDAIGAVIDQLRSQIDAPPAERESHRFMTEAELLLLARTDGAEIGAHGMTHQQLSTLGADEQRIEIVEARARLQALTATDVATMAYPYGGPETFDGTSERLAAEAGYDVVCLGSPGAVHPSTPPHRLPRFVVRNWSGDELLASVQHWFREHA